MTTKTPIGKSLLLSGAVLVDPAQKIHKKMDVLFQHGLVAALGKPGELKAKAKAAKASEIDADGMLLAPGFIDLNAHIYEPGAEHLESFATGSASAAAGGFTSLAIQPSSTPLNDNAFMTDFILRRAQENSSVRIFPIGTASAAKEGKRLAEIGSMAEAGAKAVGDAGKSIMDSYLMRKALEYTRAFSLPVFSYAEDSYLFGSGVMGEGIHSNRLGLRGIPAAAEEIMVARDIVLARHTNGRLHFSSISTKGAVEAIRVAKKEGLAITAETNPPYFSLTIAAIASYDANYKCFPPLREQEDVDALVEALADGTLDCIATNHTPQSMASKNVSFEAASAGMIGLETALPLCLELVRKKKISLDRLVELLSLNPAKIISEEKRLGTLRVGAVADAVLLQLNHKFTYESSMVRSAARNTPFIGHKFQGIVHTTFVNGSIVHQLSMAEKSVRGKA